MKNVFKALVLGLLVLLVSGCHPILGEKVKVSPGEVARIQTKSGYLDGNITNRTFRLPQCIGYCDTLVKFDATTKTRSEKVTLVFAEDRIEFTFDLSFTFYIPEKHYDQVFTVVRPKLLDGQYQISIEQVYNTFAKDMLIEESRAFLAKLSIDTVISNREQVSAELRTHLIEYMSEHSIVNLRYATIKNEVWPAPIIAAMEVAATKRESIATANAQLEVDRVEYANMQERETMRRSIEMEKANNDVDIAKVVGKTMTTEYKEYLQLQALINMSNNPNTVFTSVPLQPTISIK